MINGFFDEKNIMSSTEDMGRTLGEVPVINKPSKSFKVFECIFCSITSIFSLWQISIIAPLVIPGSTLCAGGVYSILSSTKKTFDLLPSVIYPFLSTNKAS